VCSCSRERIERVLLSLGRDELASLMNEQGGAEVTCELCRERYSFSREELQRIVDEMMSGEAC
ncbi:partial 33 kDa chaperonin, partial [Anaerolineae bacterium]